MDTLLKEKKLRFLPLFRQNAIFLLTIIILALLSACGGGGGGGGGDDAPVVNTGTFIDAPVQGLHYETVTLDGTTNSQGTFRYETGQQITFAIGGVILGTVIAKNIITPLDLVSGAEDETDPTVTNILRLLQSLDADGNPDNGIIITPVIAGEVTGSPINCNDTPENFANDLTDLIEMLNGQGAFSADTPRSPRTAGEAQVHFRQIMGDSSDPTVAALFDISSSEPLIVLEQVTFDASGSSGAISGYAWDFGDGETGVGVEASHTFEEPGTYLVTLTVSGEGNEESSLTREIEVMEPPNQNPVALFTINPETGMAPVLIAFVPAGSYDPDGEIVKYAWDYGDGKNGVGRIANHTYNTPGTYTVKLTVTDDDGSTDEASLELIVSGEEANEPPSASFTATPETGEAPLLVTFNGTASSDPDGTIQNYSWNFGDGQTGSHATVSHSFTAAGTYQVTLTVTDNDGTTASTSLEIVVLEAAVDCSTNNPCDDNATCDDSGEEITCTCNNGWTGNGITCTEIAVECENEDTRPDGGSACGLNNRGEYGRICVAGFWQDNTAICNDPDVCVDDSVTDGITPCGFNNNGTLMQECIEGQWTDSELCNDPDVCTNGDIRLGETACSGGFYRQICESGQWGDTTECVQAATDADSDGVTADTDPDDSDFTVCGDSDNDGCDDCAVSGVFDPDNDGWDKNNDGNCELPLDYDCMNGANADTDPYRLQACIMFTYINQDRDYFAAESGNAAPLHWNESIWEVAVAHSIDMCENIFFAHVNLSGQNPSDRAAAAGLSYGLAENIAINHDPGAAQYAFMEEPTCVGHRSNVLEPRAYQGAVGYYICNNPSNIQWNGAHFVTQDFRWNFAIGASAYCQNSANVCQVPPNPPTTATCPADLMAWGFCPAPSQETLNGWGCQ